MRCKSLLLLLNAANATQYLTTTTPPFFSSLPIPRAALERRECDAILDHYPSSFLLYIADTPCCS